MSGMADGEFASWLRRELESRNVDASRLVLLLDNNDIRNQIQAARLTVSLMNKLGCRVMLDSFGTSPEDNVVLKHLPGIAGVRFDSSVTSELEQDAQQLSHLQQSIAQLHQAGLQAVVTAVDHASALAQVWSLGTDYIQGEFLSSQLETPDFDFARY
jgi:EAL domain-containing protein (putative c-di-GMP-specific phosphodiesterase class I)